MKRILAILLVLTFILCWSAIGDSLTDGDNEPKIEWSIDKHEDSIKRVIAAFKITLQLPNISDELKADIRKSIIMLEKKISIIDEQQPQDIN